MPAQVPEALSGLIGQASAILTRQIGANPLQATALPRMTEVPPLAALGAGILPGNSGTLPAVVPEMPPALVPAAFDVERLRRHAHEIIETLLTGFTGKAPLDNRLPLLSSAAPVAAGGTASLTLRVANQEAEACNVSLYSTNFVADSGFEISALHVTFSPRTATIPPKGEAPFEVKVAIPSQAPPGVYSGLVQAAGTRYVKAVVSVEVT